jgi:GT2 family glycosyltransferase
MNIEVISATRYPEEQFWNKSALGLSLKRISFDNKVIPKIIFNNKRGLPVVYNEKIEGAEADSLLAFIHDDVWIDDYYFTQRIIDGLNQYDVIGVAGNRRRISGQPAWHVNQNFVWDDKQYLTGAVAHGPNPFGPISFFGKVPSACELLDGVFISAKKSSLVRANCYFDELFDFHFYDMDFCRTARKNGLTLGSWPISLTHQSGGAFNTDHWKKGHRSYIEKWKE